MSMLTPARMWLDRTSRFNPLAYLTPQMLTAQLDQFAQGHLWQVARTWEAIANRDDKLPALISKRLGALARYGWEILAPDDDPEAQQDKIALTHTFNHLTCVAADDLNETGGFSLAVRKLGLAIAHKYSACEIEWQPIETEDGMQLTCQLHHVPLWFFENTTGRLRFLETPGASEGKPLPPDEWIIARGAGLMEPCSVLYMFKKLPLGDWLTYCERYGMPGILGRTAAAKDTDEGRAMAEAVSAFGAEWEGVIYGSQSDKDGIELVQSNATGALPQPALIERCDRAMSILWRGADLSTMSAGGGTGQGASLQGDESDALEQDDAAWLSELLQNSIARKVIRWKFGREPKAYLRIRTRQTPDTQLDLAAMNALVALGMPISQTWASERFGIPLAKPNEPLLGAPAATPPPAQPPAPDAQAANDAAAIAGEKKRLQTFLDAAKARAAAGLAQDLQPLREALARVANAEPQDFSARLAEFNANFSGLWRAIARGGAFEQALTNSISSAMLDGIAKKPTQTP